jgi:signal transduction histidine kinase/CheY-like chemotaxis protein
MEKTIAEAEGLTRAVTEASPIPYVMFDEDMRAIDCNDVTLRIFECPNKKFFLEKYWELFLPESQPDGRDSLKTAMAMRDKSSVGEQASFEWYHRSFNGELIPMENTLTQVVYKGKKLMVSYKYDLRNIKKMSESIEEQSELLKIRLEQQEIISEISRGSISAGNSETFVKEAIARLGRYHEVSLVFIFNIDNQHSEVHPVYHWSADGEPPAMADFNLFDFVKDRFPQRLPESISLPLFSCPDIAVSPQKALHALLAVDVQAFICTPLYVDGELWGVMCVEQSRPRHWTENEKRFFTMTASSIAGVIMRNIYTTRLKDAVRQATDADKAKSDFLSNMSHEMRTPLNAIIGMTAIGKNATDIERKDYSLEKIGDASAHLLGVINDVLDMSKIAANKLDLSNIEFDFERMLQKVVTVSSFRMEDKKINFKLHIDKKIPKNLIGDDQRLAQVITNLLGNAVKFTPENGSIKLDTKFLSEERSTCVLQFSVKDTGIGISEEQKKRLFHSFQQAESSTARKFGGTGLGLAISKNIVEMMGGTIWVESEPEKGSTFAFTIKMKRGREEKHEEPVPEINWHDIRILVTDDDPDTLEFFREITDGLGALCDTAGSGGEALRLVDLNGVYNIYFVDWKIPGTNVFELVNTLKSKEQEPGKATVIMMSAAEWSEIADDARKAGVDRFIAKPLFPSIVEDLIKESVGVNNGRQEKKSEPEKYFHFDGYRVLLAEDVEINREIVVALLEPTLLKIDCAVDGKEAVQMFSETPGKYDLIFMDVQMPEMDGYEATRAIRALEAEKRSASKTLTGPPPPMIPIIAMTANVFKEDIERCLEAGMDSHVGKPLNLEEVMDKLNTYLPRRHTEEQNRTA